MATQKASTLTQLAVQRSALDAAFLSRRSVEWLKRQTASLSAPETLSKEIYSERTLRKRGRRISWGGLYHFYYEATTKEDLPYWDRFPLVIPLAPTEDGFIGLNLHYLSVRLRAAFMDKLMPYAMLDDDGNPEALAISYSLLKNAQNMSEVRACIKRYKFSGIRSRRMLKIHPHEWETALFLPTSMFTVPTNRVYSDSYQKMRRAQ